MYIYICKKNQACTGVELRNIIFINAATITSERTLRKKKNQAYSGIESRNIIFTYTATIISERTLRKKKKIGLVRELMYDTHLLTVVQASKWQCLKTFLGKAQNVMVTQQGVHT